MKISLLSRIYGLELTKEEFNSLPAFSLSDTLASLPNVLDIEATRNLDSFTIHIIVENTEIEHDTEIKDMGHILDRIKPLLKKREDE